MSSSYPGNPATYPSNIQIPADGDPLNAAALGTGLGQLADRTASLFDHIAKTNTDNHFSTAQTFDEQVNAQGGIQFVRPIDRVDLGHVTPSPLGGARKFVSFMGNILNGVAARTYLNAYGNFEVVVGAAWNHGASQWQMDSGVSAVTKATFTGTSGFIVNSYGGGSSTFSDTDWTKTAVLSPELATQGQVLGATADGQVGLSNALRGPLKTVSVDVPFAINVGPGSSPVRFWKDGFGVVHIEGSVSSANIPSGAPLDLFTLPAGFRPAQNFRTAVLNVAPTGLAPVVGSLAIGATTGDVSVVGFDPGAAVTTVSLDGITFRAA